MSGKSVEFSGYINIDKPAGYYLKSSPNVQVYIGHKVAGEKELFLGVGGHPITIIVSDGELFNVELGTAQSGFKTIKMEQLFCQIGQRNVWLTAKTDWASHGNHHIDNLFDDNPDSFFWVGCGPRAGESMTVVFSKTIKVDSFRVETGKPNGGDKLQAGIIEVSEDGETFVKANDITGGIGQFSSKLVKAFRIKAIADQGNWLAIKSIEIDSSELY